MPKIEILIKEIQNNIPVFEEKQTVNDRINTIRDLKDYKALLLFLRNSEFAKYFLEQEFNKKVDEDSFDMFLFLIIVAFFDINDLQHSSKLSRSVVDCKKQHWTNLLAKTCLLYASLYDPRQVV